MVNHPRRNRHNANLRGQIIPVVVQQANKPHTARIVADASSDLTAGEVAKIAGIPDDCLIGGKIVRRNNQACWLLVANVRVPVSIDAVLDDLPTLSNADLYEVPEGAIQWIKIGDVALFISRGASGGPNVVAYHVKGADREWLGGVEFVTGLAPIVMKPL